MTKWDYSVMRRRSFLTAAGASGVAALAGCIGNGDGTETDSGATETETATETTTGTTTGTAEDEPPELVVGTYSSFVDAPSTSPGPWLKETFESEFDATIRYERPDSEVNHYIERASRGVDIAADLYVGLDVNMLIRIDENLDSPMFTSVDDLSNRGDVKESLEFDPDGRAVPYDTGYICLVFNKLFGDSEFTAPETFDGLLKEQYANDLLVQNPVSSATGKAFLLHSIKAKGRDSYLDFWQKLKENGVRVLKDWGTSYDAYSKGEAPMVVSYSTDQVYAHESGEDLAKHQLRFLNDQGYANPEGMAMFEGTDQPELARTFMDFMLRPEIQAEIAVRNVQYPATTTAELPESFGKYAQAPPEAVTFNYDTLRDNLSDWTSAWERQFIGN
ncbi:thiamine ABC transporter substrate-binding protein [Halogeometricum borinquense]|uniref:Thiamine ABC transporter substrate-binding protein n=2 Tax=Halogeometricum borinquense TaxID=60847 RepID=A0A6C0UTS4_9EURY|nr:thiamine ABC transporter substrate-binding protein [Halogeometricum borinquense]QIQ75236.1 thiamine ABC transporter substrate-binding protein [Halogeometricum borinquense]